MRRSTWLKVSAAAMLVTGPVVGWALHTTSEVVVGTAPVTTGSIARRVVATGTVEAVTTVEVGSQVSGTVQALAVDYNSRVHVGQVVARLDPSIYEAQLQVAQAELAEAQANVVNAQANVGSASVQLEGGTQVLTRTEQLAEHQLVVPSDLDAARISVHLEEADRRSAFAQLVSAQAVVAQAKAAVDQARVNLDHTIIRSPIDGIVLERAVDVGQTLAAAVQSPELFRIAADLRMVQVEVAVDESDVAGLTTGEPVTFEVDAYPNQMFCGVVTQLRLQPVAEQTTTATTVGTPSTLSEQSVVATLISYTAVVSVANADERLRPGMTAQVTLGGARRDQVVRIPNAALAFRPPAAVLTALHQSAPSQPVRAAAESNGDREVRQVWLYDGQRLKPVAVHTGLSDDTWTELLSGRIDPGEAVVTSAVVQLHSRL
jgi:HlyD family secretion protein